LQRAEWGSGVTLRSSNSEPLMSALGQKQKFSKVCAMSALPPKADISGRDRNVRFVPKADIQPSLANVYTLTWLLWIIA
jgi:hypothetical protein